MFLSKYSLDRDNTIASLFRTQYTSDFLIVEHSGLRNTIFWGSKDLARLKTPRAKEGKKEKSTSVVAITVDF
jgi:hypothetical protein